MAKKIKYYAYFVPSGLSGVTEDWKKCEKIVSGKTGARFKSFDSKKDAETWLERGARYESKSQKYVTLEPGIYFDAGTGRGDGVEISITDEKGTNLLHKALSSDELNRFGKHRISNDAATNNYGELLALRYALEIAKKTNGKNIYGDSKLVIDYWSRWRMKKKELPVETVALAEEVGNMREEFEAGGGAVQRIPGGQNPADLGFHK
jgi:ribonuclease HI